ncbi:hypothetical protein NKI61_10755 [Mesorhizobium sp. M0514]|uniref:hypothetical protein n=1 Tax=Mesorhizobium sp. M0514 TaxID=2956955 RepID=UPI0033386E81
MAPNLQARMGLFRYQRDEFVNKPGNQIDPGAELGAPFPSNPSEMVSVCWSTEPALGMPVAPAVVDATQKPFSLGGHAVTVGNIQIEASTGFEANLLQHVPGAYINGLLCVLAYGNALDTDCQIFAIDASGDEIPETRQLVSHNSKVLLFGPGIFGAKATARVNLQQVLIVGFSENAELPLRSMAEVGPCLPGITCYDDQGYLGAKGDQQWSLDMRLKADALARANGNAPQSARLTSEVHQADPHTVASLVLQQEFVQRIPADFANILADPAWTYTQPVPGTIDANFEVCPSAMWQAIALMGPIEAVSLGQAVSFGVGQQFPYLGNRDEIFDWIIGQQALPFPVVRITTFHALRGFVDTGSAQGNRYAANVRKSVQFARLILGAEPTITAEATEQRPPRIRDGAASCDACLVVDAPSQLDTFFVEQVAGSENFFIEDASGAIKAYFPNSDESDILSHGGPYLRVGPVELPFTMPANVTLGVYPRDIFGRWPKRDEPICRLDPWPVQAPTFGPSNLAYAASGQAYLSTTIMWDWSIRTPSDFRLGLIAVSDGKDPGLKSSLPISGLELPGENKVRYVSIVFDSHGNPGLSGEQPDGAEVGAIDPPPADPDDLVQLAGINDPDPRTYALTMPLGPTSVIFNASPTRFVALTADAWEAVSGKTEDRRSKDKARTIARLDDPRPPTLEGSHWSLSWSSRPNGANVARAYLHGPAVTVATDLLGYMAWRAGESAVLDLALAGQDADKAATLFDAVRRETNMQVRVRLVQNIVGTQLSDPRFAQRFVGLFLAANTTLVDKGYELDVPGTQTGLEFVMFTATSRSGMMSAKFDQQGLSNLYAIAVPVPLKVSQPALQIITYDPDGVLSLVGLCVAIVGLDRQGERRGIRFFWDSNPDIADSDEILHRLEPVAELSIKDARRYIDDIDSIIGRLPFSEKRIFMLQPPQSWLPHCFCVDTVGLDAIGSDPNQDIASRRSEIVTVPMIPATPPTLVAGPPPDDRIWTVKPTGLFEQEVPGYAESAIMMSSLDEHGNELDRVGPVSYGDFVSKGLQLASALAAASYAADERPIHVSIDKASPAKFIRLSATDPAKRGASLILRTEW